MDAQQTTDRLLIRWMIRSDLPRVLEIERQSFCEPWDEDEVRAYLRGANHIGVCAERGRCIAGFMFYELGPKSFRIHNLAVAPAFRRQGVASCMIQRLQECLQRGRRRHRIDALVREGNLPAQVLLQSLGWRCVETIPEPWATSREDALRFVFLPCFTEGAENACAVTEG